MKNLKKNINDLIKTNKTILLDLELLHEFENSIKAIIKSYNNGGRLYIAGNGGSAADAQHLAAEFVCKFSNNRNPIPAEALTTDSSLITAIGNDFGFDHIFSRQVSCKINSNDIFLGITTSGNSQNIINSLKVCKSKSIPSILLTGKDGGEAKKYPDFCIKVPSRKTSTIQEVHIIMLHTVCETVEKSIFKIIKK